MAGECDNQGKWTGLPYKEEKEFYFDTHFSESMTMLNDCDQGDTDGTDKLCQDPSYARTPISIKEESDNSSDQSYMKSEFDGNGQLEMYVKMDHETCDESCVKSEYEMHHTQEIAEVNPNEPIQQYQVPYATPVVGTATIKTEAPAKKIDEGRSPLIRALLRAPLNTGNEQTEAEYHSCMTSQFDGSDPPIQQSFSQHSTSIMEAAAGNNKTSEISDDNQSSVIRALLSRPPANANSEQSQAGYQYGIPPFQPVVIAPVGSQDIETAGEVNSFKCDLCDSMFSSLGRLGIHRKSCIKSNVGDYHCDKCDKQFLHPTRLERHMITHTEGELYACNHCEKRFKWPSSLKEHMKIHTEDDGFTCDQCDRKFLRSTNLRRHLETHTGESVHACHLCKKKYAIARDLRRHMKMHTEKPFQCDECPRRFKCHADLELHSNVHKGEWKYYCDQCDRKFNRGSDLERHTAQHTGERPFVCDQCDKRYAISMDLKRHMKTHIRPKLS